MKKNKLMRAASALLVLVLLTTCVISGTFAKYVTTDTADDTARVAMFGVKIETSGSLFSENYLTTENTPATSSASASVSSKGALAAGGSSTNGISNLVAPGTKNSDGMIFSVTGTPEVSVNVEIKIDDDSASDVWLGQGLNYPNMTTGEVYDKSTEGWGTRESVVTYTNNNNYYPIKYTLQHSTTSATDGYSPVQGCEGVPLSDIVSYLDTLSAGASTTYPAGTDLSTQFGWYKLTWEWAFDGDQTLNKQSFTKDIVDKNDTLLGDLAAQKYGASVTIVQDALDAIIAAGGTAPSNGLTETTSSTTASQGHYSLEARLDFTITVTQVD